MLKKNYFVKKKDTSCAYFLKQNNGKAIIVAFYS